MPAVLATPGPFIGPPPGMQERTDRLTARRALLRLTDARPNELITYADVCAELGHEVSRSTVCLAATSGPSALSRDLPIEGVVGTGGGYVKRQPMPTLAAERCVNCAHRTPLSTCTRLKGRPVGLNCRCWGWSS